LAIFVRYDNQGPDVDVLYRSQDIAGVAYSLRALPRRGQKEPRHESIDGDAGNGTERALERKYVLIVNKRYITVAFMVGLAFI